MSLTKQIVSISELFHAGYSRNDFGAVVIRNICFASVA